MRPIALPSWLLVPGTAIFVVSLTAFFLLKRVTGFGYYDLSVYMMGGNAFLAGLPVYQQEIHSASGSGYFTYPPITLLIFGPLSQLPLGRAHAILLAGGIVALWVTIWLTMRLARFQQNAGFVGASLGTAGVALWLQPVFGSLDQGQINLMLMLLVLADFALDGRRRWPTGILIGIAAAAKITPGFFIVYLLLTRRYRAAITAAATCAAVTGFGFVVATRDSKEYWLHGTFANLRRTTSPLNVGDVSNQSLNGIVVRFLGDHGGLPWLVLALALGTLGLTIAVTAHRRGAPLAGILTTAITGLLIAPLSWHEHWVWIVPVLIWLSAVAIQVSHTSPIIAGALPVLPALPFLVWPLGTGDWRVTRQIGPESILGPAGHMWAGGNHNPLIAIAGTAYVSVGLMILLTGFVLYRLSVKTTADAAHPDLEIYPSSPASVQKRSVPGTTG
jgi:alpha-1,2-mannosyltransferase